MKKTITSSLMLVIISSLSYAQIPNIMPSYTNSSNVLNYEIIGDISKQVLKPTDLDFDTAGNLWSTLQGTENSGGYTVKFTNPGKPTQTNLRQQDGNAWHFMSLPTGIAFSTENNNFATSTGIFDANHNNTDFTGPSLWPSDGRYAINHGPNTNGSHLDMLHESPFCMGIAHEVDNVFWVTDTYTNDLVRYDFAADHGPGGSNHDDGKVRRFPEMVVNRINDNIPCHLVLDKATNWLYYVDGGTKRVLRMDITSGTPGGIPAFGQNEQLAEYTNVNGVTWQTVVNTGLVEPSGIDIVDNRLIVSDHSNGDIFIYDISHTQSMPVQEIAIVSTGEAGITGVVIGPEGRIWYSNYLQNKIVKIEPTTITVGVDAVEAKNSISVFPNPTNGLVTMTKNNNESVSVSLLDVSGKEVFANNNVIGLRNTFDFSHLSDGMYFIVLKNGNQTTTEKLLLKH